MPYSYDYPRPALTADIMLLSHSDGGSVSATSNQLADAEVLLIRRGQDPYQGSWALPGGFVNTEESVEEAAARELQEETGLANLQLEQLACFSKPGRDPRGWVVTCTFVTFVDRTTLRPKAGDDAAEVAWFRLSELLQGSVPLAFDHAEMLELANQKLQAGLIGHGLID